ncbi:MAG: ABC transporter ATP-binding protein [Armatimonadota bacterium]|nr:MAG: ABC transporter ATP-binding protein [Armatimonadota bacterium]
MSATVSVIEVRDVWKKYRRPHQEVNSLKEGLVAFLRGQSGYEEFWALKGVSFSVEPGEAIGVVGPNGSGKSTLLGLMARVLKQTSGAIKVEGRVCPLLELGTGFHVELTGRENVYLNASLLGLGNRETSRRYPDIVDFAELGDVMGAPVKTYSTGMVIRLGFSIAVHLDPDVLLIDEVLSVGDEHFQRKSFQRLLDFKRAGKTIFVVSHNLDAVKQFCERSIWLDRGWVIKDTDSEEVVAKYRAAVETWERSLEEARARDARPS